VSIIEVFAYLGAGFLIAAWHTLSMSVVGGGTNDDTVTPNLLPIGVEWLIPAVVLAALGLVLTGRSEREKRAAGLALATATIHVFGGATQLAVGLNYPLQGVVGALIASIAALAFRRLLPSVLTQATLVASLLLFASTFLTWFDVQVFGDQFDPSASRSGLIRPVLTIGWWLLWALGFGLMAAWQRRAADQGDASMRPAAERRVSVTRFAAGLTAVVGPATAAFVSDFDGRILAPWMGDLAILAVAGVLLGVAIRFGSSAYLYPAALGIVIGLSDLNQAYVAQQTGTGVALLIEGVILIGAGFVADRLRRHLGSRRGPSSSDASAPETATGPEPEPSPATPG
jgi:hypothetical protein